MYVRVTENANNGEWLPAAQKFFGLPEDPEETLERSDIANLFAFWFEYKKTTEAIVWFSVQPRDYWECIPELIALGAVVHATCRFPENRNLQIPLGNHPDADPSKL